MNLDDVAEDLVERSRLGDQNATAHISLVGEQYRTQIGGDPVRRSYAAIWRYLQSGPRRGKRRALRGPELNPEGRHLLHAMAGFGAEPAAYATRCAHLCALPLVAGGAGLHCAVIMLAAGPPVQSRLSAAANALSTPEAHEHFMKGARGELPPDANPYAFAGHAFRRAHALQEIRRNPSAANFGLLHPGLAWELGAAS